jgi:hypothetical protein
VRERRTAARRREWRDELKFDGFRAIGRLHLCRLVLVCEGRTPVDYEQTRDFDAWLESNGRSPAEMALKVRLRELLAKYFSMG